MKADLQGIRVTWVISTPLAASGPGPSRTGQAWTDHCTKGRSVEFGYGREQAELPDTTGRRDLSDIHWKEKFETFWDPWSQIDMIRNLDEILKCSGYFAQVSS